MFGAPAAILLGMTRGFTLVELLLAVALLAAVAGIAALKNNELGARSLQEIYRETSTGEPFPLEQT